jgi:hypothetical protein
MKNTKLLFLLAIATFITTAAFTQLPDPGFLIDETTAIVITDQQNDFLHEDGVAWGA